MNNKTSDKNVANIEELIQEYKTYNDLDGIQDLRPYIEVLEHILAEREQKDKRIQELEEENNKLKTHRKEFIKEKQELTTSLLDSLPKQTIIDKIAKLKNDYDEKYDLYMGYKIESRDQQDILKQMKILQELLKGEE